MRLQTFPVSLDGQVALPPGANVVEVHFEHALGLMGPKRAYEVLAIVPDPTEE